MGILGELLSELNGLIDVIRCNYSRCMKGISMVDLEIGLRSVEWS